MAERKVFLMVILVAYCVKNFVLSDRTLKLDDFEGRCSGKRHLPIVYREFQLTQSGNGTYLITIIVEAKESIHEPMKSRTLIERCSKHGPNRCSPFRDMTSDNYCEAIESTSSPLAPMYRAMKPRWKCPIRKGTYRMVNRPVEPKMAMMLMSDRCYYKFRTELFDKASDRLLMCMSGRGYLD